MKTLYALLVCMSCFVSMNAKPSGMSDELLALNASNQERMYVDRREVSPAAYDDLFHIHVGYNEWISTPIMIEDASGLYTQTNSIVRGNSSSMEYERKWKCPYCHQFWPIGTPCQNSACPSKYKA